jgi:2-dehydropantoate 2-reductase
MKVAVVGCGAVGSFYGAKLLRAGHQVHFLLRSDYEAVRRHGVSIRSPQGDFVARPKCARSSAEIGPSDLVLIGLKTTANFQLPELLPPLVGPATAVLTLQNGLGNEEQLARLFPPGQIMGGLCFVCLNRLAPGIIHHIAHGKVVLGEFGGWPEPRTHDIAGHFRQAGVASAVTADLMKAHWEKLVWNIPFNGLGVASAAGYDALIAPPPNAAREAQPVSGNVRGACLTTEDLLSDPRWEKHVLELMLEIISAARSLGFNIPDALAEEQIERTRSMGAYKASTLIDFERGQALELDSLFLEPFRQARQTDVKIPRLEALCQVLQQLDPKRE